MPNHHSHAYNYMPDLELLRQVLAPSVCSFRHSVIKTGTSPTRVHRLTLDYDPGHTGPSSLIVKAVAPHWPDDPYGPDREWNFYAHVLPHLNVNRVRVYYTGIDGETQYRIIIMEDLAHSHWFPSPAHTWTLDEMQCMLQTYARLHVEGRGCLPPEGQRAWMWRMALHRGGRDGDETFRLFQDLVEWGKWQPLSKMGRLIEQTLLDMPRFSTHPAVLLHNDVYPPNVALPLKPTTEAVLLDWEMAGWGLAELDLAFMFMQPYRSARRVVRAEALNYYWCQRAALEGQIPSVEERRALQHHADALWALSLVVVAHQVFQKPFPPGSEAAAYWDSMFGVVHERLADLCGGL